MNPGPERLTPYQRWKIVFLKEKGKSWPAIAFEVKCSEKGAKNVFKRWKETGTVDEHEGRGRKRKLDEADEKKVIRKARRGKSAPKIAAELKNEGKTVDERTIRRTLKTEEFFFLPPKKIKKLSKGHRKKRMEYAEKMKNAQWKSVLFTDEKSFWLGNPTDSCWQQLDDRKIAEISRWTPKLHVWGALGYYFKSDLYFFEEDMNAKLYQTIVSARLPPNHFAPDCPTPLRENWYFLQDNDPKHKAKGSMRLLKELTGGRMIQHPPNSPDFNVMEDVWSYLNRHVQASKVTTIRGLKKKLKELWNSLSWAEFRPSVDSMPTRLRQCITRRGARTDY